eukprot:jgi/Chrzof1/3009/Cz12g08030.t1
MSPPGLRATSSLAAALLPRSQPDKIEIVVRKPETSAPSARQLPTSNTGTHHLSECCANPSGSTLKNYGFPCD